MQTQFNRLLAAAAGLAVAGFAANASAGAIAFDLNIATAAFIETSPTFGVPLGSTLSNITQLGFQQTGVTHINLNSVTGKFDDSGSLSIGSFVKGGSSFGFADATGALTATYSLTGTDVGGILKFDNGGSVQLKEGNTVIANFVIIQPSGSTTGSVSLNGAVQTLSLGLSLAQIGNPANLFTVANSGPNGQSLEGITVDFVTAQPQFDAPGDVTPGQPCPADVAGGGGTCIAFITSGLPGTIEVDVPEPAMLGVFGIGLLGLAGIRFGRRGA